MTSASRNRATTRPARQSIIGANPHPLFIALREQYTNDVLPRWNFHKYLFGREGDLLHHWPSNVEPDDPGFRREVEKNLGSWMLCRLGESSEASGTRGGVR
jgi:glutathione peroxidase